MKRLMAWAAVAGLLFLLPQVLPEMRIHLACEVLVFALFAVSLNILFGYGGMLPFGHAATFGVGAYAFAIVLAQFPHTHLFLALAIAASSGFVASILIGFFCVRLNGAYFALASSAFQMFLYAVALKWRSVTNGDDGMSVTRPDLWLPGFGTIAFGDIRHVYYLTLVTVILAVAACYYFLKTPFGNSIVCVRERDARASFLGYNTFVVKLEAFCLSGLFAGLAGGLYVLYQEFVATTSLDSNMSMTPVLMTIIGGPGSFFGPVLGAVVYVVLQDWLSTLTNYWMLVMGMIFVAMVLYADEGLIGFLPREKIKRVFSRRRP